MTHLSWKRLKALRFAGAEWTAPAIGNWCEFQNYFKFDFSRIIQEKISRNSKLALEASIINYNKKGGDFNNTINELVDTIINIMKKRISGGKDTKDKMNLRIKASVDHFHNVHMKPDKDVAILARSFEKI